MCSMLDVIMWLPVPCMAATAPLMEALSDSVPPLVNTTSLIRQPRTAATFSLESSRACFAS